MWKIKFQSTVVTNKREIKKEDTYPLQVNSEAASRVIAHNISLHVTLHSKPHQFPFNSFRNVDGLQNLPSSTNHISRQNLELQLQFILFSHTSPGISHR